VTTAPGAVASAGHDSPQDTQLLLFAMQQKWTHSSLGLFLQPQAQAEVYRIFNAFGSLANPTKASCLQHEDSI